LSDNCVSQSAPWAIVAHRLDVRGRGLDHGRAFLHRHPGPDPVGACDFRQHQCGKRLAESCAVAAIERGVQAIAQSAQPGPVDRAFSHPLRQRLVGDAVAYRRVRIGQAIDQAFGKHLARGRVGYGELRDLQRLQ
jgi:hypothetical protein